MNSMSSESPIENTSKIRSVLCSLIFILQFFTDEYGSNDTMSSQMFNESI